MSSYVIAPTRPADAAVVARPRRVVPSWVGAVTSRVYLPACSLVLGAAILIAIGWADRWGGADFAGSVTSLRVVVAGPLTLLIVGLFLVVERLRPAQRRPIFARGYRQDLLYTILNATLVVPLVTALALSFSAVVQKSLPWLVLGRIGVLPRWGAIVLIMVFMDAMNWFVHGANHHVRVLWRFHELHHSQEDMSVLTVFRTHPLIHVSYMLALLPGVVLLANGALPITLLVIYGLVVAFAHSNTNLSFGPLDRLFVSPNFHRIHHRLDGRQDVNLGFALTIWDQLFHQAVFPTEATIRMDTGLPGRPLAVEHSGARPHHFAVLAAQLAGPFRPMPANSQEHAADETSIAP
jgi:sterol desaturase/sphingolipid hydroxylase (fatty acid hydroxylase superfamily)